MFNTQPKRFVASPLMDGTQMSKAGGRLPV